MFGESRSESPRLPSPWTEALASSKGIKYTSTSPIVLGLSTSSSAQSSRTPSSLNLSVTAPPQGASDDEGDNTENETSGDSSSLSRSGSIHSDDPARARQMSLEGGSYLDRSSQNLILSPELLGKTKLEAERDTVGHIEYKLKLIAPGPERFERLTTQLKWRLTEGGGEAMYEIGVMDDGTLIGITRPEMEASLRTLELMASELGATVMVLRTITLSSPPPIPASILIQSNSAENRQSETGTPIEESDLDRQRLLVEHQKRQKLLRRMKSGQTTSASQAEGIESQLASRVEPVIRKRSGHGALSAKNRKRMALDEGHESEESEGSDGIIGAQPLRCIEPPTIAIMDKGKGKAVDQDNVDSLEVPLTPGTPASWRERNMIRAQQDQKWRETNERTSHHPFEISTNKSLRPKKNGRFRKKAVNDRNDDVEPFALNGKSSAEEPDDNFIFDIEGIADEQQSPQPLTEAALSAFTSRLSRRDRPRQPPPEGGWKDREPLPKQVKVPLPPSEGQEAAQRAKLLRKREVKARKKEQRRLDLLRGDGMDSFFADGGSLDEDEDSDDEVKGLVRRIVAPISIGGRGVSGSSQSRVKIGQLAISPSNTLKPSSPRATSLFALQTPNLTSELAVTPSPTETLTLPLDSLSLSFAQAETVVDGGPTSSEGSPPDDKGADGANAIPTPVEERLCVEALVVKKMDVDERFGFLDFGSMGV